MSNRFSDPVKLVREADMNSKQSEMADALDAAYRGDRSKLDAIMRGGAQKLDSASKSQIPKIRESIEAKDKSILDDALDEMFRKHPGRKYQGAGEVSIRFAFRPAYRSHRSIIASQYSAE